jgi:hypothetical protein
LRPRVQPSRDWDLRHKKSRRKKSPIEELHKPFGRSADQQCCSWCDISGGKHTRSCRLRGASSFGHDHFLGNGWIRSLPLACTTRRTPLSRCQTAQEDKIYSRRLTPVFSIEQ